MERRGAAHMSRFIGLVKADLVDSHNEWHEHNAHGVGIKGQNGQIGLLSLPRFWWFKNLDRDLPH